MSHQVTLLAVSWMHDTLWVFPKKNIMTTTCRFWALDSCIPVHLPRVSWGSRLLTCMLSLELNGPTVLEIVIRDNNLNNSMSIHKHLQDMISNQIPRNVFFFPRHCYNMKPLLSGHVWWSTSTRGAAGFRPCLEPPIVPASCASCHDNWEIMMYKAAQVPGEGGTTGMRWG